MSSVNKPGTNLPALIENGAKFIDWAKGPAKFVGKAVDKGLDTVLPFKFETPTSNSTLSRGTYAGMALVYVCAGFGSTVPYVGPLASDAIVGAVGAGAAAAGNKLGNDDMANQGRLAMQTGIATAGFTAASFVLPFMGWFKMGTYFRAAWKSGKAAITGNAPAAE